MVKIKEKKMMLKYLILSWIIACSAFLCGQTSPSFAMTVPEDPYQRNITPFVIERVSLYRITGVAMYNLRGRVLSTHEYEHYDRGSSLAPLDVAVGWGRMSDPNILKQFSIRQENRWYFFHSDHLPITTQEARTHSANMHLIPGSPLVAARMKTLRVGEIIHLQGYLVNVDGYDGYHWHSSLSRDDTGNGSCELIFVQSLMHE